MEGLELVVYAGGEGADGDVADITEEVLDADFFGLFGFDYGRCVDEGFCRGCAILDYRHQPQLPPHSNHHQDPSKNPSRGFQAYIFNLLDRKVRIRRHTQLLWLHVDDNQ